MLAHDLACQVQEKPVAPNHRKHWLQYSERISYEQVCPTWAKSSTLWQTDLQEPSRSHPDLLNRPNTFLGIFSPICNLLETRSLVINAKLRGENMPKKNTCRGNLHPAKAPSAEFIPSFTPGIRYTSSHNLAAEQQYIEEECAFHTRCRIILCRISFRFDRVMLK